MHSQSGVELLRDLQAVVHGATSGAADGMLEDAGLENQIPCPAASGM